MKKALIAAAFAATSVFGMDPNSNRNIGEHNGSGESLRLRNIQVRNSLNLAMQELEEAIRGFAIRDLGDAIRDANFDKVVDLVEKNSINLQDELSNYGIPPLAAAVDFWMSHKKGDNKENSWKILEYLTKRIPLNEPSTYEGLILNFAGVYKDWDVLELLRESGADVNQESGGRTPLIYAVAHNDVDYMFWLLASGANINKTDSKGRTPLIFAVECENGNMVQKLIARGADLTATYKEKNALQLAEDQLSRASSANVERVNNLNNVVQLLRDAQAK